MREKERESETGRGRSRLHAGSPMWDLIPGLPGSHPGPKAGSKLLSHPGPVVPIFDVGEMRTQRFTDLLKDTQQVRQDLNPNLSDSGTSCITLPAAKLQGQSKELTG